MEDQTFERSQFPLQDEASMAMLSIFAGLPVNAKEVPLNNAKPEIISDAINKGVINLFIRCNFDKDNQKRFHPEASGQSAKAQKNCKITRDQFWNLFFGT